MDTATGRTVTSASAPHPDGTNEDPAARRAAWGEAGVAEHDDVVGVPVAGQQHGMVAVDGDGNPVHDALLWNDIRRDPQATRMIEEHGIQ